jgi:peptidoglycan/LPS O-acetylase OafA/YrhL
VQIDRLTQLTRIRFFAALHIFVFHLYEVHRLSGDSAQGLALPVFDSLPQPLLRWVQHGYFSTSLFFQISGFILACLYVRPDGETSIDKRAFWLARAAREYPLHIAILTLFSPLEIDFVVMNGGDVFELVVSGLLCMALLQVRSCRCAEDSGC